MNTIETAEVNLLGGITIPKRVRELMELKSKDIIVFGYMYDEIVIRKGIKPLKK